MKELEKLIDKLARQSLQPYFYEGNVEDAVSRLIEYVLYEGGGHAERAEFTNVLHKTIRDKAIEIQESDTRD